MKTVLKSDKQKLKRKLLKIEKRGLLLYKAYLTEQFINAADNKSKKKYSRYIEDLVVATDIKIQKIDKKLKR